jgi:hypothetical protein
MVEVEVDRLKGHMKGIHHKLEDRKVEPTFKEAQHI